MTIPISLNKHLLVASHPVLFSESSLALPALVTLFDFLKSWGMVDARGVLTYPADLQIRELEGISLYRLKRLLGQELIFKLPNSKHETNQKDSGKGFKDLISERLARPFDTYLRGDCALYVIDLPKYFSSLTHDYIAKHCKDDMEGMKEILKPYLASLKSEWDQMPMPERVEWFHPLRDSDTHKLENLFTSIQKIAPSVYGHNVAIKQADRKMTISCQGNKGSIHHFVGEHVQTSLASWNRMELRVDFEQEELSIPRTDPQNFSQVVANWGMKILRMPEKIEKNFHDLITFCEYLQQGYENISTRDEIEYYFSHAHILLHNEENYREFLRTLDERISTDPNSLHLVFNIVIQFYFLSPEGRIWANLWEDLVQKVSVTEEIDRKCLEIFKQYPHDFPTLVSSIIHVAMATSYLPVQGISIHKVKELAITLKVGTSYFYLPKTLFGKVENLTLPQEFEEIFPPHLLSSCQILDPSLEETVQRYVTATSQGSPKWNPYLLFTHFSQSCIQRPLPEFLKRHLSLLIEDRISQEKKALFLNWIQPWYPGFKDVSGKNGLVFIAKLSLQDAWLVFHELESSLQQGLLVPFLMDISSSYPEEVLEKIREEKNLSCEEVQSIFQNILRSPNLTTSVLQDVVQYVKEFNGYHELYTTLVKKMWQKNLDGEGNLFLLDCIKNEDMTVEEATPLLSALFQKEDPTTCHFVVLQLPSTFQLAPTMKKKLESLKTSTRPLKAEEHQVLNDILEKWLSQNAYKMAYDLVQKFPNAWNELKYASIFVRLLEAGKEDLDFIFALSTKPNRFPLESHLGLKEFYKNFYKELLSKNFQKAVTFLFLDVTRHVLDLEWHSLKKIAVTHLETSDFAACGNEVSFYFKELIKNSIPENSELIEALIILFLERWNSQPAYLTSLKVIFEQHAKTIALDFHKKEKREALVHLLKLLNLLGVKTSEDMQEIFLEALGSEELSSEFAASLQNGRFPQNSKKKQQLLLTALEKCTHEVHLKTFTQELDDKILLNELSLLLKIGENRPLLLAALIEKFSSNKKFITANLPNALAALKMIPKEKLWGYLKSWVDYFKDNGAVLHPLVKYFLEGEVKEEEIFLKTLRKIKFVDLKALTPFLECVLRTGNEGARSLVLPFLLEVDVSLHESEEYKLLWQKTLLASTKLPITLEDFLRLKKNKNFSQTSQSVIHALLQQAIKHAEGKPETLKTCIQLWKEVGLCLEVTLEIVKKLKDQKLASEMYAHLETVQVNDIELDPMRLAILQIHCLEKIDQAFFSRMFTSLHTDEERERFFLAILNQKNSFFSAMVYESKLHTLGFSLSSLIYRSLIEKFTIAGATAPLYVFLDRMLKESWLSKENYCKYKLSLLTHDMKVVKANFDKSRFLLAAQEVKKSFKNLPINHELQDFKELVTFCLVKAISSLTSEEFGDAFTAFSDLYKEEADLKSFYEKFFIALRDAKQTTSNLREVVYKPLATHLLRLKTEFNIKPSLNIIAFVYVFGNSLIAKEEANNSPHRVLNEQIIDLDPVLKKIYTLDKDNKFDLLGWREYLDKIYQGSREIRKISDESMKNGMAVFKAAQQFLENFPSNNNLRTVLNYYEKAMKVHEISVPPFFVDLLIAGFEHIAKNSDQPIDSDVTAHFLKLFHEKMEQSYIDKKEAADVLKRFKGIK